MPESLSQRIDRWSRLLLFVAAAVYVVTRFLHLLHYSLDGDEIFSLLVARHSWSRLLPYAIDDVVHPPLFYIVLKLWIAIGGEQLWWLRALPSLGAALALHPFLLLAADLKMRLPARLLAVIGLIASMDLLYFANHLRMYSWMLALSLYSVWLFFRAIRRNTWRDWLLLCALNLALVYTQYFGCFVVLAEFLYLVLTWSRLAWKMFAAGAVNLVLFAPWLWAVARAAEKKGGLGSNLGWITKPDWFMFVYFVRELFNFRYLDVPNTVIYWCMLPVAVLLWRSKGDLKRRWHRFWTGPGDRRYYLLAILALGIPLASWTLSRTMEHSIWGDRHILFAIPCFAILLSAGVFQTRGFGWLLALALLTITVHSAYRTYQLRDRKLQWDFIARELLLKADGQTPKITLYCVGKDIHFPFWFYLESTKSGKFALMRIPTAEQDHDRLAAAARKFSFHTVQTSPAAEITEPYAMVAVSSAVWKHSRPLSEILRAQGWVVGPQSRIVDFWHSITLFPIARPSHQHLLPAAKE